MTREIWVTSDTHFCHDNIIRYCNRPFNSSDEMNSEIISNWNSVVKDGDIVYHLGDVWMGPNPDQARAVLSSLKGRKRLVLGNHDDIKRHSNLLQNYFQKISMWRMFTEFGLLLTHVPIHPSSIRERMEYKSERFMNIHGHTHTNAEPDGDTRNYKCVCVELTDYKPINIEELRVI